MKTDRTSWQYIPRRVYMTQFKSETLVEREILSEAENLRMAAIRKWCYVVGHRRKLRNGEFVASEERQQLAKADGILLQNGYTYVQPYCRGKNAVEEAGLQPEEIANLPHFLRKGYAISWEGGTTETES